jgi:hypothetical protein
MRQSHAVAIFGALAIAGAVSIIRLSSHPVAWLIGLATYIPVFAMTAWTIVEPNCRAKSISVDSPSFLIPTPSYERKGGTTADSQTTGPHP